MILVSKFVVKWSKTMKHVNSILLLFCAINMASTTHAFSSIHIQAFYSAKKTLQLQHATSSSTSFHRFQPIQQQRLSSTFITTRFWTMTALKPAAGPLMDSGKAFARSGEFLIDWTKTWNTYGGALSQTGALIRNAGDCIAQAAASARFKTGWELVCDELREAATCLAEATLKLRMAIQESKLDNDDQMATMLGKS
jgi:hypothetical protein